MGFSVYEERLPFVQAQHLTSDLFPATVDPIHTTEAATRINSVFVATSDAAPVLVTLQIQDPGNNVATFVTVSIPAGAGFADGIPAVDLLAGVVFAEGALVLPANCYIQLLFPNAITAGAVVDLTALYAPV